MFNVEMGYVEPGHGMRGKKVWLFTDEEVNNMYEKHQGKPGICLWCYAYTLLVQPKVKSRVNRNRVKLMKFMKSYRRSTKEVTILSNYVHGLIWYD